jgi:hypothetical protein
MSEFRENLPTAFRGRRVRVISNQGREYVGWVQSIEKHDRHVLLRDATDVTEDRDLGNVAVSHFNVIQELDSDSRIERIPLEEIEPAPYSTRQLDASENRGFIAKIENREFVGSFPVVREVEDGYEIVEGHKRLWAAEQAALDSHPVEIVDVDAWEATEAFESDRLPDEGQVRDDGSTHDNCYDDGETEAAIERLVDDWGPAALELDTVAFNVDRLDLDVGHEDDSDEEDTNTNSDTDSDTETDSITDTGTDTETDTDEGPGEGASLEVDVDDSLAAHEAVAAVLGEAGEATVTQLAATIDAPSGTIHSALHTLNKHDRIEKRSHPDDGRTKLYSLTTADGADAGDDAADDSEPPADDKSSEEDAETFECIECGDEFDTERARKIHHGHVHDTSDELSEDIDEELGIEDAEPADENEDVAADGSGADTMNAVDVDAPGTEQPPGPTVDDEVDRTTSKYLPDEYDRSDIKAIVEDVRYVQEVADAVGIDKPAARTMLSNLGLYGLVREGAEYRGGVPE